MSKNLATTTIASHPGPPTSATSVTVATGTGSRLYVGMAVIHPANTTPTPANAEVISITDVTGDVLTIVRAQESSTARAIATGDVITQGITAAMWDTLVASNAAKAPASHTHSAADITSGTFPLARGGTGGTDAATARTNLGLGTAAVESPATLAANAAFTATYAPLAGPGAADRGYDVVIVAGQSNAVGNGTTIAKDYTDPPHPRIWRWVTSANGTGALTSYRSMITLASDPLGHPDTLSGVGPGMEFARWYVDTLKTSRRVLIVPVAVQATQLVTTTPPTWNSIVSGSLLDNAIGYANAAIAAAGANARLAAVLWVQGESDALASASSGAYQTALDALITKCRAQITGASSSTPFVLGSMVPSWVAAPNGTSVSIAAVHAATPGRVAYTGYAVGPTGSGNLHYTEAEARILGRSMHAAYLTALTNVPAPTAPGAPTGLTATPGNGQAALSWTAPTSGFPALTDYLVEYKASASGAWLTFADGTSATASATVTGLTNGTAYDFRVSGINPTGTGPASSTATATPAAPTAPGAPTGLTATPGNGQVALSWTAPASNGGSAITDYVVQFRTPSGSGAWTTFSDGTSTGTTATVTGLTNAVGYGFQVAAVNAIGAGAFTAEATATPNGAFVVDTFSGGAAADLVSRSGEVGATWAKVTGTSGVASVSAGGVVVAGTTQDVVYYASGVPATANYSVTVDIVNNTTTSGLIGPAVRQSTTADTCYVVATSSGSWVIVRRVAGTPTVLASVTPSGGVSASEVYTVTVAATGTTITGRIRRASDGQYLTSAGAWQVAPVDAISVTDSSIAAAGRAALWMKTSAVGATADNFTAL